VDDNFAIDREHALLVCRALRAFQDKNNVHINWFTQCDVNTGFDDELLFAMKDAGCMNIFMNLARGRKSSGNWTGAVSSYKELIRLFADSDEARTSKVSIGQIYLHHLRKPKAALAAFNDYLEQQGPLTQEALFGRAQAFRASNDLRNEIESLNTYLHSFPNGVYAEAVQNRLQELQ
jgi:tetratricopeptide (TPR) repeat protein